MKQLWSQKGGRQTPILLSVDGNSRETTILSKILNLPIVYHKNHVSLGTIGRINNHVKFSLIQGFLFFPNADKVIILEDDLIISNDFIR